MFSLDSSLEHPIQEPTIYDIVDANENDPIHIWVYKGKLDNFMLIMTKSWDFMISGDRNNSRQYSFLESMDPVNMIKENTSIPIFVFGYFAQKEISDLIDKTLEKTCLTSMKQMDLPSFQL